MNPIDEKVIKLVNGLIEVSKGGQLSFASAAGEVNAAEFRSLFLDYAAEREKYVLELLTQVAALGGDVEKSQKAASSVSHKAPSSSGSGEVSAVLAACEQSEEKAVAAYTEALAAELDPETRGVVARQASEIQSACDRIKLLNSSVVCATAA